MSLMDDDRLEVDIQDEGGRVYSDVTWRWGSSFGECISNALAGCTPQRLVHVMVTTLDSHTHLWHEGVLELS